MQKCLDDNARIYTYQQNYGSVRLKSTGAVLHNVPLNGVFCTGRHSYIWNTGYALNDDDYEILSGSRANYDAFVNGDRVDKNDFKLLKVEDNTVNSATNTPICVLTEPLLMDINLTKITTT